MEISPPLAERLCENLPWADIACGASIDVEQTGSGCGGLELIPAKEDDKSGDPPVPTGEHLGHLPLPEWLPDPPSEGPPHALLSPAVRRAGEVAGPITVTICLAALVWKTGCESGSGRHQKKRRATRRKRCAA
jgi:hypothetical protein